MDLWCSPMMRRGPQAEQVISISGFENKNIC